MASAEFDFETTTPPEMVLAALTDFSERRPQLWPDLSPEYYEVYEVGETSAEAREGTGAPVSIWAREAYDWSTPGKVTWVATDSNFCTPGSGVTAEVTPSGSGGSHVHVEWQRKGTTLKGKVLIGMIGMTGGKPYARQLKKAMDALPQRMQPTET